MTNLIPSERELLPALKQISVRRKATFAACCATRLFPTYEVFHKVSGDGDPALLLRFLDEVWVVIATNESVNSGWDQQQRQVSEFLESEQGSLEDLNPWYLYAEDALAAVEYCWRTLLTNDPYEPVWAARRVYESIGRYVEDTQLVHATNAAEVDELEKNELIQQEFERRRRDLKELSNADNLDVHMFRQRAESEPALPNDALPKQR